MNASQQIDQYISSLTDWRGKQLAHLRKLIHEASPDLREEWKWGTPVFATKTNVCAISAFKAHVKVNFFKGAKLSDPHGIINAGLDAKTMRSIDLREGDTINEPAFKDLVHAATTLK